MPDDRFADRFRLCDLCVERLEEIKRDDPALKLEGEVGAGLILRRSADVVEEGCE